MNLIFCTNLLLKEDRYFSTFMLKRKNITKATKLYQIRIHRKGRDSTKIDEMIRNPESKDFNQSSVTFLVISENLFWHRSQSMLGLSCSTPPLLLSGFEAPQPIGPGCTQAGNNLVYAAFTRKTRAARKQRIIQFTRHSLPELGLRASTDYWYRVQF